MSGIFRTSRRGLLALAPLALARCAGLPGGACTPGTPNPVPIGISQALPFVPMTVKGWPVTALLDTGAESTLVSETLLPALGLPIDPRRQTFQMGATGRTASRPIAFLPQLRLGSLQIPSHQVGVVNRPGMLAPDGNAPQLILGGDILGTHDLDIDLPSRRVTLRPGQRCQVEAAGFPVPVYELPMQVIRRRIVAAVTVNGRPATAVLDTGANIVHLSRDSAARLGVTEAEIAAAPQRQVRGINNESLGFSMIRLASLGIGPERHSGVPAVVGEPLIADLVIGTPWLLNRRLFVSYASGTLFVAVPAGMPAA